MKLTTVKLWGELGDRFSPEFQVEVATVREALGCAIPANFPEWRSYILSKNATYSVVLSGDNWEKELTPDAVDFPSSGCTITVIPQAQGSGGFFQSFALIGIGLLTGNTGFILAGIASGLQSIFFGNPSASENPDDPQSSYFQGGNYNVSEFNVIDIVVGVTMQKQPQVLSQKISSTYTAI
jgi:predicted phage tail protein